MSGHGPDAGAFEKASSIDSSRPERIRDMLAIMFESRWVLHPTRQALEAEQLQTDYQQCWQRLKKNFDGKA